MRRIGPVRSSQNSLPGGGAPVETLRVSQAPAVPPGAPPRSLPREAIAPICPDRGFSQYLWFILRTERSYCGDPHRSSNVGQFWDEFHITKRGSKHLRTALIEAAHVVARRGPQSLKGFFQRIRLKKGYKIAILALARKLLTIIHHLLTHQEFFEEEGKPKKKPRLPNASVPVQQYDVHQMIEILVSAEYLVKKPAGTK